MNTAKFLDIATAVANLRTISKTTRIMSLSAINAKIITAHAGSDGRTFEPLTNYITCLCEDIDEIANQMSTEALSLSRLSISEMKLDRELQRFKKAETINPDIKQCIHVAEHIITQKMDSFKRNKEQHYYNLDGIIYDVDKLCKQAKYININCRVEASHVPKERDKFNAVAEDMMKSIDSIMHIVESFKEITIKTKRLTL